MHVFCTKYLSVGSVMELLSSARIYGSKDHGVYCMIVVVRLDRQELQWWGVYCAAHPYCLYGNGPGTGRFQHDGTGIAAIHSTALALSSDGKGVL